LGGIGRADIGLSILCLGGLHREVPGKLCFGALSAFGDRRWFLFSPRVGWYIKTREY
jgi:hypothetical protein